LVIYEANVTICLHQTKEGAFDSNTENKPEGFAKIYDFGMHGSSYYMVMDLMGPSLNDLMKFCGNKFSLKTTLMIGY